MTSSVFSDLNWGLNGNGEKRMKVKDRILGGSAE